MCVHARARVYDKEIGLKRKKVATKKSVDVIFAGLL